MTDELRAEIAALRERLRLAEAEVRAGEAAFVRVFEASLDAIFWADGETGIILRCNAAAERLMGRSREALVGTHQRDLHPREMSGEFIEMFQAHVARGGELNDLAVVVTASGEQIPVQITATIAEVDGRPLVQGVFRDLSEQRHAEAEQLRLEQQIQQTQKLESLGLLAGGIAHDFNNLLMGVLGNTGLAQQNLEPDSPARPFLDQIETAARRASELTNQLLAYSGRGRFSVRPLDLTALVREMAGLLLRVVAKDAAVRLELAEAGPLTVADAAQLRQVVMNLITNASDALEDGPGTVTVRTGEATLGRAELDSMLLGVGCEPGELAWLEVSDTGCGMDAETVEQIFDPFYSTKVRGRGLGLAAVLGIVRGHRGAVEVSSTPGEGTIFRVYLPLAQDAVLPVEDLVETGTRADSGGLVMVIDDEPIVRETVELILEESGFEALPAADGSEALQLFRARADEVRLVLLDLTMPGLGGEETLRQLRAIRADVPVVLTSGYSADDTAGSLGTLRPDGFIQKPYTPDQLLSLIHRTLRDADARAR